MSTALRATTVESVFSLFKLLNIKIINDGGFIKVKIAVVYWSGSGNTEAMAEEIAKACNGDLYQASDFNANLVADYHAIAFGCPAMGAEELEDIEFEPMLDA